MSFNIFKLFSKKKKSLPEPNYRFKWLEPGKENPFNKKVLDIRSFTWNIIPSLDDETALEKYRLLRFSDGQEYIDKDIEESETSETFLEFPHNGSKVEGIMYKSESFDIKWDIYSYNKIIYFANSWTGELIYKAYLEILDNKNAAIYKIEYPKDTSFEMANSAVYYLVKSHIDDIIFPHRVPSELKTEIEIALYSSDQYGSKACYACYEDVTNVAIVSDTNDA